MNRNRREFFKISSAAGVSLILGIHLPVEAEGFSQASGQSDAFVPNAYIRIDADGIVTLMVHRSEMGQGVQTALPMILADELEADWNSIRLEQAPADSVYGDQVTGGSVSIQSSYGTLRMAGAAARMMLVAAAAQTWGVDSTSCRADNGFVVHDSSGQRLSYGDLVPIAATLPVPRRGDIVLKAPEDFRYIGTPKGQINNLDFVTGKPVYGSDVRLPNMLYAVVARCPVFGGQAASFDSTGAEAVGGVRQILQISTGIAVVAESTWAALQGREALDIVWDNGENVDLDSASIRQMAIDRIDAAAQNSDTTAGAASVIEARYEAPYLAHADMEPMVCVADVRADGCDVWAPTQSRQDAKRRAQSITRLSGDSVRIHVPLIGGGFGRRLRVDYVGEAVEISKAVSAPVKLIWTREDDLQHDFYRPASCHYLRAGLDADGNPTSWEHYIAAQPIGGSSELSQGINVPYQIPRKNVRPSALSLDVPTGYWRSVFNTNNAFVNECFIDELAAQSGQDPYAFRMSLLRDSDPLKEVLQLAAEQAGWGTPLLEGWGRGIACHTIWSTPVAQVVEVSLINGRLIIHRVVCAINCGTPINPDMIRAQMEGGIVFGLTSALYGEITLNRGQVEQNNFRDYPLMRFDEMPAIEVYIVPSDAAPVGTGEMGNPPATPALLNAIYAITGKRIRRLPIRDEDLVSD